MKKQIAAILCISGLILGGCGNAALAEQGTSMEQTESAQAESTNICAYVRAIQGDTIVVDPVQYISSEDGDKVLTYKHIDDDMPDRYYLYNEDEKNERVYTDGSDGVFVSGLGTRVRRNR